MNFHALLFNNLHWKITALALAVFTWLSLHWKGIEETGGQNSVQRTIHVLTSSEDGRGFHLNPAEVQVTFRATRQDVMALDESGIQVFVDLTDPSNSDAAAVRRLQVRSLEGIKVIKIDPSRVYVEPKLTLETNRFTPSIVNP